MTERVSTGSEQSLRDALVKAIAGPNDCFTPNGCEIEVAIADALLASEQFVIEARGPERSTPHLDDPCECGHAFGYHCTPEFPNGGYCAVSDISTAAFGCSCNAFRAARTQLPVDPQ